MSNLQRLINHITRNEINYYKKRGMKCKSFGRERVLNRKATKDLDYKGLIRYRNA